MHLADFYGTNKLSLGSKIFFFLFEFFILNSLPIEKTALNRYQTDFHGFLSSTLGDMEENSRKIVYRFLLFFRKESNKFNKTSDLAINPNCIGVGVDLPADLNFCYIKKTKSKTKFIPIL